MLVYSSTKSLTSVNSLAEPAAPCPSCRARPLLIRELLVRELHIVDDPAHQGDDEVDIRAHVFSRASSYLGSITLGCNGSGCGLLQNVRPHLSHGSGALGIHPLTG
jgi:hypothetical protein